MRINRFPAMLCLVAFFDVGGASHVLTNRKTSMPMSIPVVTAVENDDVENGDDGTWEEF